MQNASIHDIKNELLLLSQKELIEICLRLAKFKKENKEFINFLLFESKDEDAFILNSKSLVDSQFNGINPNWYLAKKTIRKVLRTINTLNKFSKSPKVEVELLIHFCSELKSLEFDLSPGTVIGNLYENQIRKLNSAIGKMHEDLQYDYHQILENKLNIKTRID